MTFMRWALSACFAGIALAGTAQVTFTRDVLPILQNHCQECHRPGEAAPMAFLNYQQVRPWAKAIREAVLIRKMPPWFADPHYGKFQNDRRLSQQEIGTLVAWSDGGAREGDMKDAPPPRQFVDGWDIGQPDAVFEMPQAYAVPAAGTVEYQYVVIPTGFSEDKWVQFAECRPGNRKLVHHMIAFIREPGSKWLKDAKPGIPFVPARGERRKDAQGRERRDDDSVPNAELLVGFAPGLPAAVLRPGQAKLVKAGSDIVLQMHYTANGKAGDDRSKVGVIFAKQPPRERIFTAAAVNNKFVIPAGDPNYEVHSEITLYKDAKLTDLMPHMHLRGKDFVYKAVYPSGETETLLSVPGYDFSWQLFYYLSDQKILPKGTRIECTAHFDNSVNKAGNPDPTREVRWGDQSWEEMMIGWFDIAVPVDQNPIDVFRKPKPAARNGD